MGYCGACRREELTIMSVNDVDFKSDSILVSIPKTKTNKPRLFAITDSEWIDLIKTYHNLRPKNVTHSRRFFLTYRKGYCINSPIGINTFGKMPKVIATFLKLPNPELFTGHCFRRSSASHLANRGGDLITIKRHGGWKSSAVAEGYIEQSIKKKVEVAQILSCASTSRASQPGNPVPVVVCSKENTKATSTIVVSDNRSVQQNFRSSETISGMPGITINSHDSSTVTINVYNNSRSSSEQN
jgi:hypothetical protein